jgi:hypothetical protein
MQVAAVALHSVVIYISLVCYQTKLRTHARLIYSARKDMTRIIRET